MEELRIKLKAARKALRISQSTAAQRAGISLATLQNIEAGRANPELATLHSLMRILGLQLTVSPIELDWNELTGLGLPLMGDGDSHQRPDPLLIIEKLSHLAPQIASLPADNRQAKALGSWLWAIHDHYPRLWRKIDWMVRQWFLSLDSSQLSINLRRLSIQALSQT